MGATRNQRRNPAGPIAWALTGGVAAALAAAEGWSWIHPVSDYPAPAGLAAWALALGIATGATLGLLSASIAKRARLGAFALATAVTLFVCLRLLPVGNWVYPTAGSPAAAIALGALVFALVATSFWLLSRRRPVPALALALVPALVPFVETRSIQAAGHPADSMPRAVLLITVDTLRADHLGCYGYERDTSPRIDRLAAESVLFERAFTAMPTTDPSHVAILTGLYPRTSGVVKNGLSIASWETESLASWMLARGYRTGSITSRSHLNPDALRLAGFQTYSAPSSRIGRSHAEHVVRRVRTWLDRHGNEPSFLWVHFWDPHDPYDPPPGPERALFVDRYEGELLKRLEEGGPASGRFYTDEQIAYATGLYDGEIRFADRRIGQVIEMVREHFGREDVLVALTADHGEILGELDREFLYAFDHGLLLRRGALHVPLIVSWPDRVHAGRRVSVPVSSAGLTPTLTALLGGPPLTADVQPFAHLLTEESVSVAPNPVFVERRLFTESQRTFAQVGEQAVIEGPWMYVVNDERGPLLLDIEADPDGARDLAQERPAEAARMAALLRDFEQNHPRTPIDTSSLDPEKVAALRALGYVQ
jgi:arylsulfatase A-like enzyme